MKLTLRLSTLRLVLRILPNYLFTALHFMDLI